MAETFNNQSSYLYAYNNPIRFTDFMGMNAEDKVEDEDPPKKEETKKQEPTPKEPETDPLMDGWSDEAPEEEEHQNPYDVKPSKEEHDKTVEEMEAGVKEIDAKRAEDIKKSEEKANVMIAEHDAKLEKRREIAVKVICLPIFVGQALIETLFKNTLLPGPIYLDPLDGKRPQGGA